MIDEQVFTKLKETMGDVLPILIDAFKEDGQALLQDMQQGVKDESLEKITIAAHTLKSSAKNVGAMILAEHCAEVEATISNDAPLDINRLTKLCELSQGEMDVVLKELDQLV